MTVARLRVSMSGSALVGAGLLTFYTRNITPGGFPGSVKTFLTSCASAIPTGVTFDVPSSGDTINETTGELVGAWTGTGGGTVTGTATGTFTLGSGARIEWLTSIPFDGYHPRGRTFLVPLTNLAFDASGRLGAASVTQFKNAADALVTAAGGDLVVWTRPRKAYTGPRGPVAARAGTIVPITSTLVPTTPTALRSRRT